MLKDLSGTPRSIEDIEEALQQAKRALLGVVRKEISPELAVMLPTIIEVLQETLERRKKEAPEEG